MQERVVEKKVVQPQEAIAFDPKEFAEAFRSVNEWLVRKTRMQNYELPRINLVEDHGNISALQFTDNPTIRIITGFKEFFGQDSEKVESAIWRFFGLTSLLRDRKLDKWLKPNPGDSNSSLVHDAVIGAAATVRLTKDGKFPLQKFLQQVEALAADKGE